MLVSVLPAKRWQEFILSPETWAASPTQGPGGDEELRYVVT